MGNNTLPHKIVEGDTVYIKVIDFPHYQFAGESMWVVLVDGDDNNGTGTIANEPTGSDLKFGDLIRFAGGTDTIKPSFVELVSNNKEGDN